MEEAGFKIKCEDMKVSSQEKESSFKEINQNWNLILVLEWKGLVEEVYMMRFVHEGLEQFGFIAVGFEQME